MHILIDRDAMCVRYKNENLQSLLDIAHIEMSDVKMVTTPIDAATLGNCFTDLELKLLIENVSAQKYAGYNRDHLLRTAEAVCAAVEVSELNGFEIALQAAAIPKDDHAIYQYAPGSQIPSKQEGLFTPKALIAHEVTLPLHNPSLANVVRAAPATPAANVFKPAHVPRAASVPTEAPKTGSKTGRVWEIAEGIWETAGKPSEFKAIRKQIIDACEAEGINGSTASVQYGKWKATK